MEKKTTALGTVNNEVDFWQGIRYGTRSRSREFFWQTGFPIPAVSKAGIFSKLFGVGEKALCTFRIHDEEVPRAKRLVARCSVTRTNVRR